MPTPVEHLAIAERILAAPTLPESVRAFLALDEAVLGAFFFGNIAPDVQIVSRQPREITHFFTLPPTSRRPAYVRMLAAHPPLRQPSTLTSAQVAFLAGYISHLLLDECWVREVFYPVFGPKQTWGDWRERLLLHNVLRAWLDRRDLSQLRDGIGDLLVYAEPNSWLAFVTDVDLNRWRNLVANQLMSGAAIRTVEIFAKRSRIPDTEFLALLETRVMNERIFCHIPLAELDRFYDRIVVHSQDLIISYLSGCVADQSE